MDSEALLRLLIFGGLILIGAVLIGLEARRLKRKHDADAAKRAWERARERMGGNDGEV